MTSTTAYQFTNSHLSTDKDSALTMTVDSIEMIKITKEGFWVRGVKVEADEQEAEKVYTAFKRWLVESALRG